MVVGLAEPSPSDTVLETTDVVHAAPALQLRGLTKSFGPVKALADADLDLLRGEVLGLVGRNGSGKSTLIKILSGYHDPDPGATLHINGREVELPLMRADVRTNGLAFVHQDLGLLPEATVLENMRLGRYATTKSGRIAWRAERAAVAEALERFGAKVSPDALVSSLRQVDRALVAIVRGLTDLHDPATGILVLDEPTAYLPRDSVDQLFATVRAVAAQGTSVVFVSHRLEEVTAITDRVTVLRDGVVVGTVDTKASDEARLIEMILGRKLEDLYPEASTADLGPTVLQVSGLTGTIASDVSFTLHAGEVVGLTGIAGMGYDEVPYLLFGATQASSGEITFPDAGTGSTAPRPAKQMTPRDAKAMGMALLPADRIRASGAQEFTLAENVSLPVLPKYFVGLRLRHAHEKRTVGTMLTDYNVKAPGPTTKLSELSGGNQQKALLGKWLQTSPKVLLLHEPTQGVDVGAKKDVFERLRRAAADGASVVIASAEYEDLAHLCDRVLVFRDGRIVASMQGADLTEERIVEQSYRNDRAARSDG